MRKAIPYSLASAGLALLLTGAAPSPYDMESLRGTIQWTEGDIYVVRASNGDQLKLKLASNAAIATRVNTVLWPLSEGSYLGIAGTPQTNGSLRAVQVGIFHEALRGAAEGYRSRDSQHQATMTYGTAWQVAKAADSDQAVLYYMDGQKKIVIPYGTPVATYLSGNVADLRPGAAIYVPLAARLRDDLLEAEYVMLEGQDTAHE